MIKTKWRMEPLCSANPGFFNALWLLSWQQHFLHNNVFMTLLPAGGLLANKGRQDSLRERQNTHSAIYLQEQKNTFSGVNRFCFFFVCLFFVCLFVFFSALALLPKCKSLTLPIRHLLPGLPKTIFSI